MGLPEKNEILESGGYAKKQIFSDCSVLRWSHSQRFKKAIKLVKKLKVKNIVDYGCGDATFLLMASEYTKRNVGLEVDKNQLKLLKDRFKNQINFEFHHIEESYNNKADLVTCFEVLEHCTEENVQVVLKRIRSLCSENGYAVISVPKETGLTLLGKQIVRRLLAWRKYGSYEYSEWYSLKNFLKMLFATENTQVKRNYYDVHYDGVAYTTCGHYAFNWKKLKKNIEQHFEIESIEFTPNIIPMGLISSQVWFICKTK